MLQETSCVLVDRCVQRWQEGSVPKDNTAAYSPQLRFQRRENVAGMDEITRAEMRKIGINISDPRQAVGTMSGGQRQTLAIARAIYFGARVLILDEPTSALGQKQQMEVLRTMMSVRSRGDIAIIFITHNETHSKLVADRYTFLALGEVIGRGTREELKGEDIRHLMAGGVEIGDLSRELAQF